MRQLTGLDTNFLNLETANSPLHVGSVIVLEGAVAYDEIRAVIEDRLHLLAPFRWRLLETPLGIDHPYWIDDPDFDVEFHVRRIAVPAPGDARQLSDIVARIHARPLDRRRPLWEVYVIEGLEEGHTGVQSKIHHAAIDGVSGTELLTILLDVTPDADPPEPPGELPRDRIPTTAELLLRGSINLVAQPWRAFQAVRRTAEALPLLGRYAKSLLPETWSDGDGELLAQPRLQAPRTRFNDMISPHRRWAFGSVSLEDVKKVKNAHGVTVNDVVMTMCAGALRTYLRDRDELPAAPLQAMVPISVRTKDQQGAMGNQVSGMVALLPTHLDKPLERLEHAHDAMVIAKENDAVPANVLADYSEFAMPAVAARAARAVTRAGWARRFRAPWNVVISNVPGPQFPLYLAGAQLRHVFPVSAIIDGSGLNITLQSYLGSLDFGLVADRDMAPDLWDLMGLIQSELDALVAVS